MIPKAPVTSSAAGRGIYPVGIEARWNSSSSSFGVSIRLPCASTFNSNGSYDYRQLIMKLTSLTSSDWLFRPIRGSTALIPEDHFLRIKRFYGHNRPRRKPKSQHLCYVSFRHSIMIGTLDFLVNSSRHTQHPSRPGSTMVSAKPCPAPVSNLTIASSPSVQNHAKILLPNKAVASLADIGLVNHMNFSLTILSFPPLSACFLHSITSCNQISFIDMNACIYYTDAGKPLQHLL